MNALNQNVTNRKVVMQGDGPEEARTVTVIGGFGALAELAGTAIFVRDVAGSEFRMDGMEIEKFAPEAPTQGAANG